MAQKVYLLSLNSAGFHKSYYLSVCYVNSGESDARIINDTTQIVALRSDIAESDEFFILDVTANNTLDVVNGTTSIEVVDNDGIINCMTLIVT